MAAPNPRRGRHTFVTVVLLLAVVAGMTGLVSVSVPLYRLFCAATGYEGTTQRASAAPDEIAKGYVTVRFDAETAPGLGWDFAPMVNEVRVHPGEQKQVFFRAVNRTDRTVVGHATYNVTPSKAGLYFDKLQCFCFTRQVLKPGESRDMGVVFFVDPDIRTDPGTRDVRTITLSYTMFRQASASSADAAPSAPQPDVN